MNIKRYLSPAVQRDLKKKMVFIGGPRQAGKTTLGLSLLKPPHTKNPAYLSWDIPAQRSLILKHHFPLQRKLLVLKEILKV